VNPVLILTIASSTKKQVYFVLLVLLIILCLPVMAVFALGTSALSFLSGSSGNASAVAISPQSQGLYEGPPVLGDYYAWGNCTYWAFALRLQANDPIPTSWGNAATWAFYAQLGGYLVDHTPSAGAIMQIPNVDNGLGHVAYVTAVDPAGNWTISEMNVQGLDIIDIKTMPAAADQNFNFIHDKEVL
jgi:surface antigen